MPKKYTTEQFWKLYEKLPEELQEAIFSQETADNIWDICEKNNIQEVSKVADYAGQTLLGILPPEDFQETLEKELNFKKDLAKKVTQEINRFIFYPVRINLEQLYKTEIAPVGKTTDAGGILPLEEKTTAPSLGGKDTYREPVE